MAVVPTSSSRKKFRAFSRRAVLLLMCCGLGIKSNQEQLIRWDIVHTVLGTAPPAIVADQEPVAALLDPVDDDKNSLLIVGNNKDNTAATPAKPEQQSASPSVTLIRVPPSLPCVYAPWPGGWGNVMYQVLASLLASAQEGLAQAQQNQQQNDTAVVVVTKQLVPTFPCLLGYGGMVANLFQNIANCQDLPPPPGHPQWHHSQCAWDNATYRRLITRDGDFEFTAQQQKVNLMKHYRRYIAKHGPSQPTLWQLNQTMVQNVFAQTQVPFGTAQHLQQAQTCAAHVRLGDVWFRNPDTMHAVQSPGLPGKGRACKIDLNQTECFRRLLKFVQQEACPNKTRPWYVASDVPAFVDHVCHVARKQGRTMYSPCPNLTSHVNTHINDVGVALVNEQYQVHPQGLPAFLTILSEWLALALVPTLAKKGASTFSEVARMFYTNLTPTMMETSITASDDDEEEKERSLR
mmetsp:Transcript_31998/g.66787  ORF Transcript_31998/g.66787 Transcript_31998/m.66787 type:complete len:462 (-) Transcript_31998:191-1576(-)